jgi:hypothetical protein
VYGEKWVRVVVAMKMVGGEVARLHREDKNQHGGVCGSYTPNCANSNEHHSHHCLAI